MENTFIISKNAENGIAKMLITIIKTKYEQKEKKDIWKLSEWSRIAELENDYVGGVGETFLQQLCDSCNIPAVIDGTKTKELGGGCGDGTIHGRSVEIKTARAGTGNTMSFQHELGERPWHAEYMCFIDIAPDKFYITIFPNFTEEQYKQCSKCEPYFPTRSFCWRKKSGCFKLDTTENLNETQSTVPYNYTMRWNKETSFDNVGNFINKIITPK